MHLKWILKIYVNLGLLSWRVSLVVWVVILLEIKAFAVVLSWTVVLLIKQVFCPSGPHL